MAKQHNTQNHRMFLEHPMIAELLGNCRRLLRRVGLKPGSTPSSREPLILRADVKMLESHL
jgi:hypothetical protein